ncbi:MAG: hypothetical protein HN979_08930 [Actinobacteria bacterium]|nr:hypothetical protein [Actinomycetota bacterium]MBT3687299.1 hypothetical protein [Actinomycetota bacterium]MBT4037849.1 hypothetical protein [Actinomycetota bacterium]MBT4279604.1 hypothetical protein [Actinomycetota bacterium]MBT4343652.1 hypothetical protein [Actinomycetota bacterium]
MGLVARAIEAAGTPTICLTAARSITEAANPPRAAFVDMPLGYTVGRPHDPGFQTDLLNRALTAAWSITEPGTIVDIGVQWSDDQSWKDAATSGLDNGIRKADGDSRSPRIDEPQYQYESDRAAAEATTA